MAVDTWGPFVFVNRDAGAASLSEALGDLPAVVASHGTDMNALRFHHRVEYEIRANWKIALENYLERCHCQLNHPGAGGGDRRPAARAGGARPAGEPVQPGASRLRRRRGQPRGPVPPALPGFLDYFFAPDVSEAWIAEFLAFDDQVGAEDTALVEGAQAGAASGLVADGRLLGRDEQLIAHFQAYVRERLT